MTFKVNANAAHSSIVVDFHDFKILDLDTLVWLPVVCSYPKCRGGIHAVVETSRGWLLSGARMRYLMLFCIFINFDINVIIIIFNTNLLIYVFMYVFINVFINKFIHLFMYSFINLFYLCVYSFINSFIYVFVCSFIHLFIHRRNANRGIERYAKIQK